MDIKTLTISALDWVRYAQDVGVNPQISYSVGVASLSSGPMDRIPVPANGGTAGSESRKAAGGDPSRVQS
jgi:hypothetical protein